MNPSRRNYLKAPALCLKEVFQQYLLIIHEIADYYDLTLDPVLNDPELVYSLTQVLMETAENSKVLRSGEIQSGNTKDTRAYESDGAHVNLVQMLVSLYFETMLYRKVPIRYILNHPTLFAKRLYRRFTWPHWSIIEAVIKMHDFPENKYKDIPDNGTRNETTKRLEEHLYLERLEKYYIKIYGERKARKIRQLYYEFEGRSTPLGRVIYCADKIAAPLYFINSDRRGKRSYVSRKEVEKSETNIRSAKLCRKTKRGFLIGQLWTVDYVYTRELIKYDEDMFFTAIAVMMTLIVYGEWFDVELHHVEQ